MEATVIEADGLNVIRSGATVIENASFKINRGDYVGIVGPNGGGKTTLLEAVLGILPVESGSIKLLGEPLNEFDQWSKLAWCSQHSISFDDNFPLSVRELVSLGRINRGNLGRRLGKEDWSRVDETLRFMGIDDLSDHRIGHLSGGQKQRVFVAKAIVRNPEVLILDEPVAGVDASAQERFYMKLSDLNTKYGTTILIVSHDLAAVFCRMNRVMCVNRRVYTSMINPDIDPNDVLQKAYGEHFHFVFHKHECKRVFEDE